MKKKFLLLLTPLLALFMAGCEKTFKSPVFTGKYNFFDYKYNIPGYSGQDYASHAQNIYLIVSLVLMVVFLIALRKMSKSGVTKLISFIGIFITVLYLIKSTWESYYDIKQLGEFNFNLLPLDTCSIIMPAAIIAGLGKGKIQHVAECWLATGGIVGGIATMLFLNALKFYPYLSFGAFYSMTWHFLMVFTGLLIIVKDHLEWNYGVVVKGFLFHVIFSAVVIPVDFIFDLDFMLYKNLGGVPFFEDVAGKLTSLKLGFLNPLLMLALYFAAFNLIYFAVVLIRKIISAFKNGKKSAKLKNHV